MSSGARADELSAADRRERERLRHLRLTQVRKQEAEHAAAVRQHYRMQLRETQERAQQEVRQEWDQSKQQEVDALQQRMHAALASLGVAHEAAGEEHRRAVEDSRQQHLEGQRASMAAEVRFHAAHSTIQARLQAQQQRLQEREEWKRRAAEQAQAVRQALADAASRRKSEYAAELLTPYLPRGIDDGPAATVVRRVASAPPQPRDTHRPLPDLPSGDVEEKRRLAAAEAKAAAIASREEAAQRRGRSALRKELMLREGEEITTALQRMHELQRQRNLVSFSMEAIDRREREHARVTATKTFEQDYLNAAFERELPDFLPSAQPPEARANDALPRTAQPRVTQRPAAPVNTAAHEAAATAASSAAPQLPAHAPAVSATRSFVGASAPSAADDDEEDVDWPVLTAVPVAAPERGIPSTVRSAVHSGAAGDAVHSGAAIDARPAMAHAEAVALRGPSSAAVDEDDSEDADATPRAALTPIHEDGAEEASLHDEGDDDTALPSSDRARTEPRPRPARAAAHAQPPSRAAAAVVDEEQEEQTAKAPNHVDTKADPTPVPAPAVVKAETGVQTSPKVERDQRAPAAEHKVDQPAAPAPAPAVGAPAPVVTAHSGAGPADVPAPPAPAAPVVVAPAPVSTAPVWHQAPSRAAVARDDTLDKLEEMVDDLVQFHLEHLAHLPEQIMVDDLPRRPQRSTSAAATTAAAAGARSSLAEAHSATLPQPGDSKSSLLAALDEAEAFLRESQRRLRGDPLPAAPSAAAVAALAATVDVEDAPPTDPAPRAPPVEEEEEEDAAAALPLRSAQLTDYFANEYRSPGLDRKRAAGLAVPFEDEEGVSEHVLEHASLNEYFRGYHSVLDRASAPPGDQAEATRSVRMSAAHATTTTTTSSASAAAAAAMRAPSSATCAHGPQEHCEACSDTVERWLAESGSGPAHAAVLPQPQVAERDTAKPQPTATPPALAADLRGGAVPTASTESRRGAAVTESVVTDAAVVSAVAEQVAASITESLRSAQDRGAIASTGAVDVDVDLTVRDGVVASEVTRVAPRTAPAARSALVREARAAVRSTHQSVVASQSTAMPAADSDSADSSSQSLREAFLARKRDVAARLSERRQRQREARPPPAQTAAPAQAQIARGVVEKQERAEPSSEKPLLAVPRPRISVLEMRQRAARNYEQLPEVRAQRAADERRASLRRRLESAKSFGQRVREKAARGAHSTRK